MNNKGIYLTYKKILIELLQEKELNKDELIKQYKNRLVYVDLPERNFKTIERVLKKMKDDEDYDIEFIKKGANMFYRINGSPEFILLSDDEKNSFPVLLGLLDAEKELPTISKTKELITKEYGISKSEQNPYPYFVNAQAEIYNHEKIILLAGKIVEYARNGMALKYLYKNKEGTEDFKIVAPLQVRFYDYRYYLLALDIDKDTYEIKTILKNYTLDTFIGLDVYPATKEHDESLDYDDYIKFDHEKHYKSSQIESKLKHSLGIWYDPENTITIYKLKFFDWAKGIVLNKKLHHSQKIVETKENYVIIQLTAWDNREIDFLLGKFGDKCERLN